MGWVGWGVGYAGGWGALTDPSTNAGLVWSVFLFGCSRRKCACRFDRLRWFSILAAVGHCNKHVISAVNKAYLIKWEMKVNESRKHTKDSCSESSKP